MPRNHRAISDNLAAEVVAAVAGGRSVRSVAEWERISYRAAIDCLHRAGVSPKGTDDPERLRQRARWARNQRAKRERERQERTTGADGMNAEPTSSGSPLEVLTPALWRVARLVAQGANNEAVAAVVGVSEATVRTQLTMIYDRLELTGQGRAKVRVRLAYLVGRWDREQARQMGVTTR